MNVEIVAIGSELLLGQSTDTNSVWISQQLALSGIDCFHHNSVGDNTARIVSVLERALDRSDVVICCGGLGPTQDDVTRQCIAQVMGVELAQDDSLVAHMEKLFALRQIPMAKSNLQQALVPVGATTLAEKPGTAAGLRCDVAGRGVIYAVPGVPYEMKEMVTGSILPDLLTKAGSDSIIASRVLRTWGTSESQMAELLADRIAYHDAKKGVTLAYLASGVEGLKIRVTAKAESQGAVDELLDEEEAWLRSLLGSMVFGLDEQTMESVVLDHLRSQGLMLAVAESLTGGYVSGRICAVSGASEAYLGGVVAYNESVKRSLLGVEASELISEECALQMAYGVRKQLGSDIACATTGVAGPKKMEGKPVGTVCMAIVGAGEDFSMTVTFTKSRERIRQLSTIELLNQLRLRL